MKGVKKLVAAVLPSIGLLLLLEGGLRAAYYQRHAAQPVAILAGLSKLAAWLAPARARKHLERELEQAGVPTDLELNEMAGQLQIALYSPAGRELLTRFQAEYAADFQVLVEGTRAIGSKLLVLYIPSEEYHRGTLYRRDACRAFFRELAQRHAVDFLDVTDGLLDYPSEWTTLLPLDGHLSRFGHHLVAQHLAEALDGVSDHRSHHRFSERPLQLGDLGPGYDAVLQHIPHMPFRLVTNAQGFRMPHDLDFPKRGQRVLILGDSFTFGANLNAQDTFPRLLAAMRPELDVINAGLIGYTIMDESSLFMERARFAEPDVTVLQVVDNDVFGYFFFLKNLFARVKTRVEPTAAELNLISSALGRPEIAPRAEASTP